MQQAARETTQAEVRSQVLAWVREALEDPSVEPADNFLDVGGHSLAAARINKLLEQHYGLRMSIQTLFEASLEQACDQAVPVAA